jgi:hypothetical protein
MEARLSASNNINLEIVLEGIVTSIVPEAEIDTFAGFSISEISHSISVEEGVPEIVNLRSWLEMGDVNSYVSEN